MKPTELKLLLSEEIMYQFNVFTILSDMQKENPYEYNIIEYFVQKCKKEREKIQNRKENNNDKD